MPPKKKEVKKNEPVVMEDTGPMPRQFVQFKFNFNITKSEIENYTICFEFINSEYSVERIDLPLIDTWEVKDQENQPNIVSYEHEFSHIKIDEKFCKLLTGQNFKIMFVNVEESKIIQEVELDYSEFLMYSPDKLSYNYVHDKLKIIQIEKFDMTISFDKPLLQEVFKHYLNPMEIEVIGVKDLPVCVDKDYEPCYVKYTHFEGSTVQSQQKIQKSKIRWNYKHVFLMGLEDQVKTMEDFRGKFLKMEVHDKDELLDNQVRQEIPILDVTQKIKEEEERNKPPEEEIVDPKGKKGAKKPAKKEDPPKKDAKKDAKKKPAAGGQVQLGELIRDEQDPSKEYVKTNYAVAVFFLTDFLKPNVRHIKLRSPIVPVKKYEDLESQNLQLNTTAKKTMRGLIESATYMQSDAFLVCGFTLAYPLNTFVMPEIPQEEVEAKQEDKKPAKPAKPAKDAKPQQEAEEEKPEAPKKEAIYERVVYITPYKSNGWVEQIQNAFFTINMEAAKIEQTGQLGLRALANKALTQEEKDDRNFDYLGGFEILDNNFRFFMFEGLSSGAMKKLETLVPRDQPNTDVRKILKNNQVLFEDRLYQDFNLDIKRIRLRDNLHHILGKPNIYMRTKVPEHIYQVLLQLQDIRKCNNMKQLAQFNYFPNAKHLISMERKYSDALTPEDIHGYQIEVKKGKKREKTQTQTQTLNTSNNEIQQKLIAGQLKNTLLSQQDLDVNTLNQAQVEMDQQAAYQQELEQQQYQQSLPPITQTAYKKHKSTFQQSIKSKVDTNYYDKHITSIVEDNDQEVYIYASQKLNWYDQQARKLREQIQQDPHNFYTYSEKHLGLSIDPHCLIDEKRKEYLQEQKRLKQKPAFRAIAPKTQEERNQLPKKPHQSVIDDLAQNPYYQQRQEAEKFKKPIRGLKIDGKVDFKQHIGTVGVFSNPEIVQSEFITPEEKAKQEKELKDKEIQNWQSKLKGDPYIYIKKGQEQKASQIDKHKNLLEGKAIKQGLMLKKTRIKESTLRMEKQIQDLPSSIHHQEEWVPPNLEFFTRKVNPDKVIDAYDFDANQNPEYLTKSSVYKPLKQNNFESVK